MVGVGRGGVSCSNWQDRAGAPCRPLPAPLTCLGTSCISRSLPLPGQPRLQHSGSHTLPLRTVSWVLELCDWNCITCWLLSSNTFQTSNTTAGCSYWQSRSWLRTPPDPPLHKLHIYGSVTWWHDMPWHVMTLWLRLTCNYILFQCKDIPTLCRNSQGLLFSGSH